MRAQCSLFPLSYMPGHAWFPTCFLSLTADRVHSPLPFPSRDMLGTLQPSATAGARGSAMRDDLLAVLSRGCDLASDVLPVGSYLKPRKERKDTHRQRGQRPGLPGHRLWCACKHRAHAGPWRVQQKQAVLEKRGTRLAGRAGMKLASRSLETHGPAQGTGVPSWCTSQRLRCCEGSLSPLRPGFLIRWEAL